MPFDSEGSRQHYFKQFGITAWYPRKVLRNGLPGHNFPLARNVRQASSFELIYQKPEMTEPKVSSFQTAGVVTDEAESTSDLSEVVISDLIGSMSTTHESLESPATSVNYKKQILDQSKMPVSPDAQVSKEWDTPDEVWCKSVRRIGSKSKAIDLLILAKLNFPNYDIEHQLLHNIVRALYRFTDLPIFQEFFWPPFADSNIPFQHEETKVKLLKRWVMEADCSCLAIFNEEVMPELESGTYLPSLAQLIEKPSRKHDAWNTLRQQYLAP